MLGPQAQQRASEDGRHLVQVVGIGHPVCIVCVSHVRSVRGFAYAAIGHLPEGAEKRRIGQVENCGRVVYRKGAPCGRIG
jgi:hypothetical protein